MSDLCAKEKAACEPYPGANSVGDVTTASLGILASVDDLDVEVGVLVQNLLYATVVAALLGLNRTRLRGLVLVVVIVLVVAVWLVVAKGLVVVR